MKSPMSGDNDEETLEKTWNLFVLTDKKKYEREFFESIFPLDSISSSSLVEKQQLVNNGNYPIMTC